jgi:hypothetical protein
MPGALLCFPVLPRLQQAVENLLPHVPEHPQFVFHLRLFQQYLVLLSLQLVALVVQGLPLYLMIP